MWERLVGTTRSLIPHRDLHRLGFLLNIRAESPNLTAPHMSMRFRASGVAAMLCVLLAATSGASAGCKDAPAPGVDWHGCNKQLIQLDNTDLAGANLESAFLSGTHFRGTNLAKSNFQMSELVRTSFDGADLSGANLEKALAARATFKAAKLAGIRLVKVEFQRVNFEGADLSGAEIEEAELMRSSFAGANLSNANFTGATLARSIFTGANLAGAHFERAYLYWARFEGVDLSAVSGLTQEQIDITCGDKDTKLPSGLTAPARWPCGED